MFFGCKHNWYPVGVFHYLDNSYTSPGIPTSRITLRCLKCGDMKTHEEYGNGHLTLEQLRNAPTQFKQP